MRDEGYFEWLLRNSGISPDYSILCSVLQDTLFHPIIPMDENRWMDGVQYRSVYADGDQEVLKELRKEYGGCTMFELVLSLAEKMQFEMCESIYDRSVGYWAEELIANAGLDIYTNDEMMSNEAAFFQVQHILNMIVFRKYSWTGEGGLFPLQYPQEDQRNVELAIQMNKYLMERYDIFGDPS